MQLIITATLHIDGDAFDSSTGRELEFGVLANKFRRVLTDAYGIPHPSEPSRTELVFSDMNGNQYGAATIRKIDA